MPVSVKASEYLWLAEIRCECVSVPDFPLPAQTKHVITAARRYWPGYPVSSFQLEDRMAAWMDTLKPELTAWAKVNWRLVPGPAESRGRSWSWRSSTLFLFLKTRNCWLRCYWTTAGNKSPLWMTDWHRAPAHTWDSQPVSSEGVKINIPIRKTSVQAVKSTATQHEERGAKQSFPLRTHIVVLMNLLKLMELWTNKEVTGSGQHQEFCFC